MKMSQSVRGERREAWIFGGGEEQEEQKGLN